MGRTGVILAAGFGSRLRGVSDDTFLKPLTEVGGEPLLVRAVRGLERAGCEKVVVVLGHGADDVRQDLEAAWDGETDLVFAVNPRYDLSNGVSVLAARPHVNGHPFILAMADHVVEDAVMRLAGDHDPVSGGATLLVDRKLDSIFDMDDATKVRTDAAGERIVVIGKQLEDFDCVDTGVFVCTDGLMEALEAHFEEHGDASLSDGVQELAAAGRMHVLDIGDGFWQDVDTPEMLAHAEDVLSR